MNFNHPSNTKTFSYINSPNGITHFVICFLSAKTPSDWNLRKMEDNKENIPPSSVKEADPVLQESEFSCSDVKLKRRFRRPLRDITNLFFFDKPTQLMGSAESSGFGLKSLPSSSSSSALCRKRKTTEDDFDLKQKSKILRKDFR